MKVREIMSEKTIVGQVPGSRRETLRIMVKSNITGMPVVNKDTKTFEGFVARQDFFEHPEENQLALIMKKEYPSVKPETSMTEAARILVENDFHHLPVVDGKKRVVGIVTPADFLVIVEKNRIKTPVGELIRSPCIPIYEKTPLRVAAAITGISNVYALPVLNDAGRLSGIITDRDIFNLHMVNAKMAISDLGMSGDMDKWAWEGVSNVMKLYYEVSKINLPKIMVRDIMIKNPLTAFEKTPVCEAARVMRKNDYGQLPVRDAKDKLRGMLYELDTLVTLIG